MKEGRKQFFFEKKNQKTFVLRAWALERATPRQQKAWMAAFAAMTGVGTKQGHTHQEQKFFAELFFKKATAYLVLS